MLGVTARQGRLRNIQMVGVLVFRLLRPLVRDDFPLREAEIKKRHLDGTRWPI